MKNNRIVMRKVIGYTLSKFVAVLGLVVVGSGTGVSAKDVNDRLVILHTNDTHSIIDPYHENDRGGVARRKVLIDSVRSAEPNVMLVDAGDVVQGSLYFTLFGGEVEQKVMNALGYDIQILGNHEFDNGMESLARYLKGLNATLLASNYDMRATEIDSLFKAYLVKEVGDKKIGFLAINIDPDGLIDDAKIEGVKYLDGVKAANALAWVLRNTLKCDYVVALTHIGYDDGKLSDRCLAENTENIDLIIGGHSHTLIDPSAADAKQSVFTNAAGRPVVVAQTGRYGANLGKVVIDFDSDEIVTSIIPVNGRLDSRIDMKGLELLADYKPKVDSINGIVIGKAMGDFNRKPELMNWMADFVLTDAKRLTNKKIDMAIVNGGGVRSPILKGNITKGNIMQSFPFDNYEVVLEIKGSDLIATLDSMAAGGGNGVSRNVSALISPKEGKCQSLTINGKTIDPEKLYYVATINYLAAGNDGMEPLKNGKIIGKSTNYLYDDMISAFERGWLKNKKQTPDSTVRMKIAE